MSNQIGCVIMAAGDSTRFGENDKLLESFADETIIEHVLSAVPFGMLDRSLLVAGSEAVIQTVSKFNIQVIINTKPKLGIGRTIKLGTAALGPSYDGYMYIVGDQPLLTSDSITKLITFWREHPENIVSLAYGSRIGNPVIFPRACYEEIMGLADDEYGRVVYRRHLDLLKTVQISDEYELMDVDTIEDLVVVKDHLKK